MEDRQTLHTLVDALPEPELQAAKRYLEYLRQTADPLRQALDNAPIDDEPLSDEELLAIEEGRRDLAAGRTVSHEDFKRRFRESR